VATAAASAVAHRAAAVLQVAASEAAHLNSRALRDLVYFTA